MRRRAFVTALGLGVIHGRPTHGADGEILVLAAASLNDALSEIGAAYTRAGGERVVLSFAGSGDLARQLLAGAPAAVFVSADAASVDQLQRAGRVAAGDRCDLLGNRLVVVRPAGSSLRIGSAADLAAARRIALADPEFVPAGRYARQWLESVGAWPQLRDRIVPALDVRAALAAAETRAVDAAIVYATDARLSRGRRSRTWCRPRRRRASSTSRRCWRPPVGASTSTCARPRPARSSSGSVSRRRSRCGAREPSTGIEGRVRCS